MKVLLITPVYPPPPGGIQTLTRNLKKGLEANGVQVKLLYVPSKSFKNYNIIDYMPNFRSATAVRSGSIRLYPYFNLVYRKSKNAIASFAPDVVHAIHIHCWPALIAVNEQNLTSVVSVHAAELSNTQVTATTVENADGIHAVSEYTKSIVERDHGESKIEVIYPSIDVDAYKGGSKKDNEGNVFSICRQVERKNIDVLIKAWKYLSPEVRANRHLKIAGDGPLHESLTDLAYGHNDIELLGRISEEEKRQYLKESALFVLPAGGSSYDVEGFGIVYLEAQAAGTPTVGSTRGGAPEAIGTGGVCVENEQNPRELATVIEKLLTDKSVYSQKVKAAKERIQQFDIKPIGKNYIQLYENISDDKIGSIE